jgi:hypothetical protein
MKSWAARESMYTDDALQGEIKKLVQSIKDGDQPKGVYHELAELYQAHRQQTNADSFEGRLKQAEMVPQRRSELMRIIRSKDALEAFLTGGGIRDALALARGGKRTKGSEEENLRGTLGFAAREKIRSALERVIRVLSRAGKADPSGAVPLDRGFALVRYWAAKPEVGGNYNVVTSAQREESAEDDVDSPQAAKAPRQLPSAVPVLLSDELFRKLSSLSRFGGGAHPAEVASRALDSLSPVDSDLLKNAPPGSVPAPVLPTPPIPEPHPARLNVLVTRKTSRRLAEFARVSHLEVEEVAAIILLHTDPKVLNKSHRAALDVEEGRELDLRNRAELGADCILPPVPDKPGSKEESCA